MKKGGGRPHTQNGHAPEPANACVPNAKLLRLSHGRECFVFDTHDFNNTYICNTHTDLPRSCVVPSSSYTNVATHNPHRTRSRPVGANYFVAHAYSIPQGPRGGEVVEGWSRVAVESCAGIYIGG